MSSIEQQHKHQEESQASIDMSQELARSRSPSSESTDVPRHEAHNLQLPFSSSNVTLPSNPDILSSLSAVHETLLELPTERLSTTGQALVKDLHETITASTLVVSEVNVGDVVQKMMVHLGQAMNGLRETDLFKERISKKGEFVNTEMLQQSMLGQFGEWLKAGLSFDRANLKRQLLGLLEGMQQFLSNTELASNDSKDKEVHFKEDEAKPSEESKSKPTGIVQFAGIPPPPLVQSQGSNKGVEEIFKDEAKVATAPVKKDNLMITKLVETLRSLHSNEQIAGILNLIHSHLQPYLEQFFIQSGNDLSLTLSENDKARFNFITDMLLSATENMTSLIESWSGIKLDKLKLHGWQLICQAQEKLKEKKLKEEVLEAVQVALTEPESEKFPQLLQTLTSALKETIATSAHQRLYHELIHDVALVTDRIITDPLTVRLSDSIENLVRDALVSPQTGTVTLKPELIHDAQIILPALLKHLQLVNLKDWRYKDDELELVLQGVKVRVGELAPRQIKVTMLYEPSPTEEQDKENVESVAPVSLPGGWFSAKEEERIILTTPSTTKTFEPPPIQDRALMQIEM